MRRLWLSALLILAGSPLLAAEPSKFTLSQAGSAGNVSASSSEVCTDNQILRANGTAPTAIQCSVLTVADTTGNLTGPSGGFSIIGGTGATDDLILDGSAGTAGSASVTEDGRFISGVAGTATNPSFKLPGGAAGLFDDYGTGGAAISYATGTGFALYAGTIPKLIVDNAAPGGLKLPAASLLGWGALGGTITTQLYGDVSDTLSLRRTTNPQSFKLYGTYTDASNYERLSLSCDGTADCTIATETAGAGADDMPLHLTGAGVSGVQYDLSVEANTAGSGTPNALAADETAKILTNEGASAQNYHTLPTAAAGLCFEFVVQDADGLRVVANTGDTIRVAGSVSATAGYIQNSTIGGAIRLCAINATEWFAMSSVGTWTVDS